MVKTKKHVKIPSQFKGSFLRNVGIIGLNVKYNAEALTTFLVDLNEFLTVASSFFRVIVASFLGSLLPRLV